MAIKKNSSLSTSYDFIKVEEVNAIYWAKKTKEKTKIAQKNFAILMPPPNITGQLHIGHALNNFIQDTLIRFYKLQGKNTLWIPGFDHAGIATEIVVNRWIKNNHWKVKDSEMLTQYFQKWAHQQKKEIAHQWKKWGLMINFDLTVFTLEPQFAMAVRKAFVQLYQENLIYQAEKLVNFDLTLQTVISDIEVNYKVKKGKMYYLKYWEEKQKEYLIVATTRPETIFADQALVIHPEDKRYHKWLGKKVINPLTKTIIPVITSKLVKQKLGTGVLKCTPGHDFKDFQIGQAYQLKVVNCFNQKGQLTTLGMEFAGKERLVARPLIIQKLKREQLWVKEEKIEHQMPYSSKSDSLIEPMLSKQWFIKTQSWVEKLLKEKKAINFIPPNFKAHFLKWIENCQDWCISRQLSWGHKLPVYYNQKKEILVRVTPPSNQEWKESQDVLDTWFSSGLWSLFNSGWNNPQKKALKQILPIDYLVTSYDIIFFWVVRMLFLHYHFKKELPFRKILIHGLFRTKDHQKMSKSKGNVLQPEQLIKQYGVDSLRLYLLSNYKIGQDLTFQVDKLQQAYQFCNKLWNIDYFITLQKKNQKNLAIEIENCQEEINIYIIHKIKKLLETNNKKFSNHLWSLMIQEIVNFVWKDFSNFYLVLAKQLIKNQINKEEVIQIVNWSWQQILLLLHPYLPFLTHYLWNKHFPEIDIFAFHQKSNQKTVKKLKNYQSQEKISEKIFLIKAKLKNKPEKQNNLKILTFEPLFWEKNLVKINLLLEPWTAQIKVVERAKIEKVIILAKEATKEEMEKEILLLEKEMSRSQKILGNQLFLQKAKKTVILLEQEKAKKNQKKLVFLKKKVAKATKEKN